MRRPSALRCESLEDRAVPAALTVLVGGDPFADTTPDWLLDLATAVGRRTGRPVGQIDDSVATYDPATNTLTAPAAKTDFVVLNWDGATTAEAAEKAGAKLAEYLKTLLPASGTLDLHFIGAGAGAFVNVQAIRELAGDDGKVGRLQMTVLDARLPEGGDARTVPVPYNVDWADNFYQTSTQTAGLRLGGTSVGFELDVTAATTAWAGRTGDNAAHDEVHDWYHWTVDLTPGPGFPERDPVLSAQRSAFASGDPALTRATLYGQSVDLDQNGTPDDLGGGANVGFGVSIRTLFAPRNLSAQSALDLVLVIDTTGSMSDDIDAVKERALEILNTVQTQTPDARIGVVLYRDNPDGSHGDFADYQATVLLAFTRDFAAARAAIQGIEVGGGADWAESVYSGMLKAVDAAQDLGAWRGGTVRKSVILMGDAPPQLDEPGTGFTKQGSLIRTARAGVDVATVATNASADAWWMFKAIADLTSGRFYYTGSAPPAGGDWGETGGFGEYPYLPYAYGPDVLIPAVMYAEDGTPLPPPPAAPGVAAYRDGSATASAESVLRAVRDIAASFLGDLDPEDLAGAFTVVGSRDGAPTVTLYAADGSVLLDLTDAVRGVFGTVGEAVTADFNGDGTPDLAVGSGAGGAATVMLFDGLFRDTLGTLNPFEAGFTGGVSVATGDVTGDGVPDVVVAAGMGGAGRVRVYDGKTFETLADFFGIEDTAFRGGSVVSVGDIDGDGFADVVVAAGLGGGPRVAGYDGAALAGGRVEKLFADFFAMDPNLRDGVSVSVGDLDGDGFCEVVAGAGVGGAPRVVGLSGKALADRGVPEAVVNFFAGDTSARSGVKVAVRSLDADGRGDILTTEPGGRVVAFLGSRADAAEGLPFESLDGALAAFVG